MQFSTDLNLGITELWLGYIIRGGFIDLKVAWTRLEVSRMLFFAISPIDLNSADPLRIVNTIAMRIDDVG